MGVILEFLIRIVLKFVGRNATIIIFNLYIRNMYINTILVETVLYSSMIIAENLLLNFW